MTTAPHCAEHERRGDRITSAEGCIRNSKYNWEEGREHMQKREDAIELEMKGKLSQKAFAWIIGILLSIVLGINAVQWNVSMEISHKVDDIAFKQGKVYGKWEYVFGSVDRPKLSLANA